MIAKQIKKSLQTTEQLSSLSNEKIAELLIEHIWCEYDVFSAESDLLQEAIERLKTPKEK